MSAIYDNWEKLVAAVLKKEQLWQLFHADSISPSLSSGSSGFSFCRLTSSLDDVPFSFSSPEWSMSNQREDDGFTSANTSPTQTINASVETFSSNQNASLTPPRKRDLKIQVPKLGIEDRGFSGASASCPILRSRVNRDCAKQESYPLPLPPAAISNTVQESYPLPLPPAAISNTVHVFPPNSAKLPSPPLRSPERAERVKSPASSWKKGKLICQGPLGGVYLGFNSEKGQMCAMKEVSLSPDDPALKNHSRMLSKEIALLSCINHPNIVQYYGPETVADNFYICFEYMSGGSVNMILQQYGRLGELAIRSYTQQILSGLAYLHSKNIAHRDIKGASLFVDRNGIVKLCNFAIEKKITEQSHKSWLMDSSYWMAPEVIMNSNVQLAVDIWSLGCTILEMATTRPPLSQYDRVVAMSKIACHKELPSFPDHLSDVCKDFLRHCLQWEPLYRATACQLLEHPFVRNSSPLGKQILVYAPSDHAVATNSVKPEVSDNGKSPRQLDSGKVVFHSCKASKPSHHLSDIYTPRNISAPVSPAGSPVLHPRSPQHRNQQMSPLPIPSLHTSSMLAVGRVGAIQHPHLKQSTLQQETSRIWRKQSPNTDTTYTTSYWDPNILQGVFRFS